MLLETLLPLGKVDPGLRAPEVPLDLATIGRDARLLEGLCYHGMVVEARAALGGDAPTHHRRHPPHLTVGTYEAIAGKLGERYGRVVTHCEFSIPVRNAADQELLRDLAKTIQGVSTPR